MTTPGKEEGPPLQPRRAVSGAAITAGDRAEAPRWRSWTVQVALVGGAALLLYFGLASWSDPAEVTQAMRRLSATAAGTAAALVVAGLALRALRWHLYTRVLRLEVPVVPSLLAFVAGFAFTATPGKVGEVVKSFLLKRRFGAPVAQTAASLVVERVTDLLAMLMLAVAGIAGGGTAGIGDGSDAAAGGGSTGAAGWLIGASAVLLAFALWFLLSPGLQSLLLGPLGRLPVVGRAARAVPPLLDSSRRLLSVGPLFAGLVLALGGWSCEALALHRILEALGAGVPLAASFFAFASSSLLGVLSMLPGGLGGFEATMVVFLRRLAVEPSTAVAATLLFRLATLWLVSLLGLAVLGGWMAFYGRGAASDGSA